MIETQAQVVSVEPGFAWVEAVRQSGCDSCSATGSCGTAAIGRVFGSRSIRMQAIDEVGVVPGDVVIVGLAESALLRASLAVYILPIAALLAAAVGMSWVFPDRGEAAVVMAGLTGLAAGFGWIWLRSAKVSSDTSMRPSILRRDYHLPRSVAVQTRS